MQVLRLFYSFAKLRSRDDDFSTRKLPMERRLLTASLRFAVTTAQSIRSNIAP
jgi:hypothetical protein